MTTEPSVLIVDDDHANRMLARALFRKQGWRAELAEDGPRALEVLGSACFNVVLLDISMPGMSGIEVCQRIRADARLSATRAVAYTAHARAEERRAFLDAGFDDVLVKPVTREAMQAVIDRALHADTR